jgi:hypothetical protein
VVWSSRCDARTDEASRERPAGLEAFFFDVLNRKLAQHIFDDLAHLAKGMVPGDGLRVPPVFAVNTASPRSLACLDHVEYGNVPWVAGECISALNPVVGHQRPSCGKSLEDLGQCFIGQSVEFGRVIGAERTLVRMFCQDGGAMPPKPRNTLSVLAT